MTVDYWTQIWIVMYYIVGNGRIVWKCCRDFGFWLILPPEWCCCVLAAILCPLAFNGQLMCDSSDCQSCHDIHLFSSDTLLSASVYIHGVRETRNKHTFSLKLKHFQLKQMWDAQSKFSTLSRFLYFYWLCCNYSASKYHFVLQNAIEQPLSFLSYVFKVVLLCQLRSKVCICHETFVIYTNKNISILQFSKTSWFIYSSEHS